MKMTRSLALMVFVTLIALIAVVTGEEFRSPVVFKSDVDLDTGAILKIQGTKVTATAAQLNAAGGGTTATITPTTATVSSTFTVTQGASGQIASGVKRTFSVVSQSVANNASLTLVPETMYVLTPTGIALDATATITLNPLAPANSATGTLFWVCNSDSATGLIAIAKTGTFYSPAITISTGQVATIMNFGTTNKFYGVNP